MRGDGGGRQVGGRAVERLRRLWSAPDGDPGPGPGWVPGPDPVPPERLGDDVPWSGSAVGRAMAGVRAGAGVPVRRVPVRAVLGALLLVVALFVGGGARILVQRSEEMPATVPGRASAAGQVAVPGRAPVPGPLPGPAAGPGPSAAAPLGPSAPAVESAGVVVHVVGRVRRPGLRRLPVGARVADAIAAAGGAVAGAATARLNLARRLVDGEQVVVPGPGEPVAPATAAEPGDTGGPAGPAAPVDLNAATQAQLDALPGVGPVLAGRILAWRTEHGRFTRVDELGEVAGIGPKALERLRPLVTV